MLNLIKLIQKLRETKKQRKMLDKPARSMARFKEQYPQYTIGSNCYGTPIIKFQLPESNLQIGSYCSIAKNVKIFLGGNHRAEWISTYPFPAFFQKAKHIKNFETTRGNVIIGSDVWLCEDCTILSGVTIGNGAVIANGAIVTKDVPPYAIVGGNPAKLIRWRFDQPTRNSLQNIAWWDWSEDEILSVVDLLCSEKIADFLEYAVQRKNRLKND